MLKIIWTRAITVDCFFQLLANREERQSIFYSNEIPIVQQNSLTAAYCLQHNKIQSGACLYQCRLNVLLARLKKSGILRRTDSARLIYGLTGVRYARTGQR